LWGEYGVVQNIITNEKAAKIVKIFRSKKELEFALQDLQFLKSNPNEFHLRVLGFDVY